jgi:hypothetical protein
MKEEKGIRNLFGAKKSLISFPPFCAAHYWKSVLQSMGNLWPTRFLVHASDALDRPPGHVYEHKESGAVVMLPAFSESDTIFEYQRAAVRTELDNFGLADPSVFAAKLQKVG